MNTNTAAGAPTAVPANGATVVVEVPAGSAFPIPTPSKRQVSVLTTVFDAQNRAVTVEGYPADEKKSADICNRFTYHAPKGDQTTRYQLLRDRAKQLAHLIDTVTPTSREGLPGTGLEPCDLWHARVVGLVLTTSIV